MKPLSRAVPLGLHQGHLLPPPQSTLHLPVIPSLARGSQLPSPGCWGRVGEKQEIMATMKGTTVSAFTAAVFPRSLGGVGVAVSYEGILSKFNQGFEMQTSHTEQRG